MYIPGDIVPLVNVKWMSCFALTRDAQGGQHYTGFKQIASLPITVGREMRGEEGMTALSCGGRYLP